MWRTKDHIPNTLMDVYNGALWKKFMTVDGKTFLKDPYNLSFKQNIDWFQPFNRTPYSMGIIYLAIDNLPRGE